ncbi:MAG: hypothetical protein PHO37_16935 [Kiritimatiellae bacterium]|nr:hypothetical protein [Kiritimatiellia bacterium]
MKLQIWAVFLLLTQLSAAACNVPVFRYALERWPVAPYRAVVLKNSDLSSKERVAFDLLDRASDSQNGVLNLVLWNPQKEDMLRSGLKEVFPGKLPVEATVHLMYPLSTGLGKPFWSGKLTKESVAKIRGSVFRDRLVKTILAGASGVFILMESGDQQRDDKIAKELQEYTAKMAANMELPPGVVAADSPITSDQDPGFDPINRLRSKIPLKLAFETLRYDRKSDEVMTALLMSIAPEHEQPVEREPLVFAVYGRGRVLAPMKGQEINMDNVSTIAAFFCAPCSCQVKALNPGTDLLLDHDWERSVFKVDEL